MQKYSELRERVPAVTRKRLSKLSKKQFIQDLETEQGQTMHWKASMLAKHLCFRHEHRLKT